MLTYDRIHQRRILIAIKLVFIVSATCDAWGIHYADLIRSLHGLKEHF